MKSNSRNSQDLSAEMEDKSTQPPAKKRKLVLEDSDVSVSSAVKEIDDVFYSRQLLVLGHEAMRRMATYDVLISGLGGLGVEISKNVILSGVKSVTLHDYTLCTFADLTSQFYLTELDIGKNRAEASLPQLSALNDYVPTKSFTGQLTEDFIKKFKVVVLTNSSLEERLRISEVTHANNIALIIADTRGLFGQVFCDFGHSFTVVDSNGENPKWTIVSNISREANGVVTCLSDMPHDFEDGDYVTFSEIRGMIELNNCQPRKITVLGRHAFNIGDTCSFSEYYSGGIVTQVKMSQLIHFKSLADALHNPEYVTTDVAKCDRPSQLHLAFATLHEFVKKHGALPRSWNNVDAQKFTSLVEALNTDGIKLDAPLLQVFAKISRGSLGPINSIIGGIVALEVIKACSGKFTPIYQWLYFDALECLPTNLEELKDEECEATGSRYDGQTAIFGKTFQNTLGALNYFVIGAGAIGCELLKNFAMMGIGAGKSGQVTVTDFDKVKKSNLAQQFLYRPADVQCYKSGRAATAVRRLNPAMNVVSREDELSIENEQFYEEAFFKSLDGVANAVDNIESRWHVDGRCVFYGKPLLETGIFGTKGNVQVVVPYLTESYMSSLDPCEEHIPISPENFPFVAEYTFHQGCYEFLMLFWWEPERAAIYLIDPEYVERIHKMPHGNSVGVMQCIKRVLVDDRPISFQDCVAWARCYWQQEFSNNIRQALFNFPADHLTADGKPFWSGLRRYPEPLEFSLDEPVHLDFVIAAANLQAEVYGIEQVRDRERIAQMVLQVSVPEFEPRERRHAKQTQKSAGDVREERYQKLKSKIPPHENFRDLHLKPLDLDIESDTNLHIDFIMAYSKLKATNFNIAPASRYKCRMTVGRVIPAIATSSSVVAGLACLELIKVAQGHKKLQSYKNVFFNMALPFFGLSEPVAARKINFNGTELTLWDHLEVRGEMTIRDFIEYFAEKFERRRVGHVAQGKHFLYADYWNESEQKERIGLMISEAWQIATKKRLEANMRVLQLVVVWHYGPAECRHGYEYTLVRYLLPDTS